MIFVVFSAMHRKGMALFPFIILKHNSDKQNGVLINHERIHIRQQIEMLVVPFYLFYILNYLFNLLNGDNRDSAYRNIVFEKEAYLNENDASYLTGRKFWAFTKYFRKSV